jgi:tetratricopeptide (TPR) repeat protein
MGFVHLHLGQYEEATSCGRRAQELVRDHGSSEYRAISKTLCASVDLVRGRYHEAQQKLEEAAPHSSGVLNTIYGDDGLLVALGITLHHLGRSKEAKRQIQQALQTATSNRRQVNLMYALAGAALLLAKSGEVERALELYALASRYPFVDNSRWFEDVVGKEITAEGQSLPAQLRDEARERGRQLNLWRTANALLGDLKEPS